MRMDGLFEIEQKCVCLASCLIEVSILSRSLSSRTQSCQLLIVNLVSYADGYVPAMASSACPGSMDVETLCTNREQLSLRLYRTEAEYDATV